MWLYAIFDMASDKRPLSAAPLRNALARRITEWTMVLLALALAVSMFIEGFA